MYYSEEKTLKKLNITRDELYFYRSIGHIKYSERTDKYDIDSILEARTFTIGLENLLTDEDKEKVIQKMEKQSSFSRYLFSQMQKGKEFTANECSKLGQVKYSLMAYEGLCAYPFAKGQFDSMKTWYKKTITNLENKILKQTEELEKITSENIHNKFHFKFVKGKRKKLAFLKNKLAKYQTKGYLSTWFGKKYKNDIEMYKKSRLSLIIQGETTFKGNRNIRFQQSNNGIDLYFYKSIYKNVKIPNSFKIDFIDSLNHFNRQTMRVHYNKKGKMVLSTTFYYIKPIPVMKTRGTVGIDIGPKEIAVCFVKNDGNPLKYKHFSIGNLLDKRTDDTKREISLILDKIIKEAKHLGFYHITIENLKFKPDHSYRSKKLNRMLHKFPRMIFESLLQSKCLRNGFTLKKINPAFTSVIGLFKYSYRDNLCTSHNAKSKDLSAALVIGRRGLGFHEKAIISIRLFGKLLSIPIKSLISQAEHCELKSNRELEKVTSNWSLWSKIKKLGYKTPDELTAHFLVNPQALVDLSEIRNLRCNSLNPALIKVGV